MKFFKLNTTAEKTSERLRSKHAEWMLGLISFTESSFFPIIVDPFLVAMILAHTKRWFRYATIAVVTSVAGGVFGYVIGALFFDMIGFKIISFYHLESVFENAVASVDQNAFWFTFIGAFTPVPYKIIVIVGGFMKINIWLFILASIVGRAGRFYIVGYITNRFGELALSRYVKGLHVIWFALAAGIVLYAFMTFIK